jgi:hypothetical protein
MREYAQHALGPVRFGDPDTFQATTPQLLW